MASRKKKVVETATDNPPHSLPSDEWTGRQPPKPGLGSKVQMVSFEESRRLVTIDWGLGWRSAEVAGAFVRVRPSADATDEEVEQLRRQIVLAGAAAIRILPKPRAKVMVAGAREPAAPRETLRRACEEIAGAVASKDKVAMLALVETTLNRVGL